MLSLALGIIFCIFYNNFLWNLNTVLFCYSFWLVFFFFKLLKPLEKHYVGKKNMFIHMYLSSVVSPSDFMAMKHTLEFPT